MLAAREAFAWLGRDLADATVAVQGYGNAGAIAARLIGEAGGTVVAASDSTGGIYDPDGFDAAAVADHKADTGSVVGYGDSEELTNEELLTLDVDLLIPAALENAIDKSLAANVAADLIVEAANGPITPAADEVLTEKDVYVVPDILANAGGVTVSYFEWVQNRQRFSWTEDRVNDELERVITTAFDGLIDTFEATDTPNLRTAAYVVALERIVSAYEQGGNWP